MKISGSSKPASHSDVLQQTIKFDSKYGWGFGKSESNKYNDVPVG